MDLKSKTLEELKKWRKICRHFCQVNGSQDWVDAYKEVAEEIKYIMIRREKD